MPRLLEESILGLMEAVEEEFEKQSVGNNTPYEMQINVLWNVKDHKKASSVSRRDSKIEKESGSRSALGNTSQRATEVQYLASLSCVGARVGHKLVMPPDNASTATRQREH
eukprot:6007498-Amphidinium_carterae.2